MTAPLPRQRAASCVQHGVQRAAATPTRQASGLLHSSLARHQGKLAAQLGAPTHKQDT